MVRQGGSRFVCLAVVVVATVLLSACDSWTQVGFGPERRRHNAAEDRITFENAGSLSEQWSASFPGSITEPILDQDRVYVGVSTGTAPTASVGSVAFDAESGTELWRDQQEYPLAAGTTAQVVATPVSLGAATLETGGFVGLAPGDCPHFYRRIDPDDGALQLQGSGLFKSSTATSGELAAATAMSTLPSCPDSSGFGLLSLIVDDAVTGNRLWTHDFTEQGHPLLMPAPAVANGRIYVTHGSKLSAFTASGCGAVTCTPLWTFEVGANPVQPVVGHDGTVFTGRNGSLYALDGATGSTLWRAPLFGARGLAYAHGFVFASGDVIADFGPLFAYAEDGCGSPSCTSPTWFAEDARSATSAPAVAGGAVYVGVAAGVFVYDVDGCGTPACDASIQLPFDSVATHVTVGQGRLVVTGSGTLGQGTAHIAVFETSSGA